MRAELGIALGGNRLVRRLRVAMTALGQEDDALETIFVGGQKRRQIPALALGVEEPLV